MEMQIFRTEDIPRYQATAKNRSEVEEKGHLITVLKIRAGQNVCRHAGKEQADGCSGKGDKNRHTVSSQNILRNTKQHFIRIQREGLRDQLVSMELNRILLCERAADNQQERKQTHSRKNRKEHIGNRVKNNSVSANGSFALIQILCHSYPPF